MPHLLLSSLAVLFVVAAQVSVLVPRPQQPLPPPPPPPVKKEERPVTPQRIRVGCNPQAAYVGPAPQWHNSGVASLSDTQIAGLEASITISPDNICARGYLIAHGQGHVSRRVDHVLWMIANHPQWEGFLQYAGQPQAGDERGAYERIRGAWLQHTGPDQRSGVALHRAAVFFQSREPEFAVELLKRAIGLEPEERLFVETLGGIYGRAQIRSANPLFTSVARAAIESSNDRVLLAGALNAIGPFHSRSTELGRMLSAKLGGPVGPVKSSFVVRDVPSLSEQYRRSQCDVLPLLRRCPDER